MSQLNAAPARNWTIAAATAALLAIGFFALTNQYIALALPFVVLLVAFFVLNLKAAWWLFLFTVPLSVQLPLLDNTLSTSLPDEPIMGLWLLTILTLLITRRKVLPAWFWRHPLTLVVALQYLWLVVAVIYSKEPLISVKFLAAKSWFLASYFLLPVLVIRRRRDFVRAWWLVLVPLVITMVIIMFRHMTMSFDFMRINKAIGILWYNRVDYSAFMAMFFPLLLVAYPLVKKTKVKTRLALLLVILFFLPCIYLTFARGAMLGVFLALAIGVAIRLRLAHLFIPVFYGIIALLMVYMVRNNKYIEYRPDYEHTYTHFTFTDHMIATFRGEDMSSMERLYRWIAAVRMSNDNPVTGVGPNAFYYYYKPYAVSSFRTYVSRNHEHSTTHNYFLFMLVEQGYPAMILYAVLVLLVFSQAQRIYHRFPKSEKFYRSVTIGLAMSFAACFITNFFSEMIETHKIGCMFYLTLALLVILDRKSRLAAAGEDVA